MFLFAVLLKTGYFTSQHKNMSTAEIRNFSLHFDKIQLTTKLSAVKFVLQNIYFSQYIRITYLIKI